MNNQVNVMIAGADMGGLIASCALHYDFQNRLLQEDRFRISRLEKDTLTMEDVEQCDLSGVEYVVNATLHDTEASFAFDEKCKKQGIPVIHAVNLGKAAFLAVEKPKGYPFSEVKSEIHMRVLLGSMKRILSKRMKIGLLLIVGMPIYSKESLASTSRSMVCFGRSLYLG